MPSSVDLDRDAVVVARGAPSPTLARGVAGDVGQRLLHDPEGGELDRGRQLLAGAVARGATSSRWRAPSATRPSRSARPGAGARGASLAAAQHVERAAQLAQRLAAGLLDVGERRAGLLGLVVDQVQGHAGLHVDQRDVVGEHVVQLLGELQPLLARAALALLLLGARPFASTASRRDADQLGDGEHDEQPTGDERQLEAGAPRRRRGSTALATAKPT